MFTLFVRPWVGGCVPLMLVIQSSSELGMLLIESSSELYILHPRIVCVLINQYDPRAIPCGQYFSQYYLFFMKSLTRNLCHSMASGKHRQADTPPHGRVKRNPNQSKGQW